ncbi:hypothetical protein [Sulfuriflexus sp.]|uniref:hypothetical protein n=1 Tax=Sulfuriflexus sp. TaxID=2015443 RepID=UPI0028CCD9E0|nr:hypothetical protein [Sulfuriflexus sp.]MDT8404795.1 hypothetical protein [Sulfuriflexus sp.]
MFKKLYLLLLMMMLALSPSTLIAEPKFPAPPDAEVSWVGKNLEFNDMPMRLRKFTSEDSVEAVLAFYRELWKEPLLENVPGHIEQDLADWKMITRPEDGYMMSVQVKPYLGSGAWGYLGISKIDDLDANVEPGFGFPKMNGSQVVNDVKHNDSVKNARTVMLQNKYSLGSNVQYYRDHYTGRGWNKVLDRTAVPGKLHTFVFRKGTNEVSMTVARTGDGSQVVANVIE